MQRYIKNKLNNIDHYDFNKKITFCSSLVEQSPGRFGTMNEMAETINIFYFVMKLFKLIL